MSSKNFQDYVNLLQKLDLLIANGKGDETEADELRDSMDGPWSKLTEAEKNKIRRMASKLFSRKSFHQLHGSNKALNKLKMLNNRLLCNEVIAMVVAIAFFLIIILGIAKLGGRLLALFFNGSI